MIRIRSYGWTAALAVVGLLACAGDGGQPLAPAANGSSGQTQSSSPMPFLDHAAPVDRAAPMLGAHGFAASAPPPLFTCAGGSGPVTGAQVIGPAGGTVVFGPHSLIIPAGALSAPTPITAATLHGDTLAVTFGPSGLHFKQPATLVLSYRQCTVQPADTLSIVLVNNKMTEMIQMVPSQDKKSKQSVQGLIEHFSVYAASESRTTPPPHHDDH
jgi:hypothetical protein